MKVCVVGSGGREHALAHALGRASDVVVTPGNPGTSKGILTYLSILSHLDDFMKGVLSTSNIIFYLSLMLVALFLTYRSIDSLRWRA